jgi:uncharacterized damage-inducible protein DinB
MLPELRELFAYNRWANQRLLGACAELSADDLARELGGSFPSVWGTLTHVFGAEGSWLARWEGTPAGKPLELGGVTDIAGLTGLWNALGDRQSRLIAGLTDDDVRRSIGIVFRSGLTFEQQLGATMRHCMNHSTYHRGQVTNFLRMLGAKPVPLDLVLYYMEYPPA